MNQQQYETILSHCIQGLPNEACGLLAGTVKGNVKTVEKVYLLTNIDESREHFSMEPKEQFAALKDARTNGWELIGNFHSHPETPSRPSDEDRRLAYDPHFEYLILSLQNSEIPVLKAFGIDENKKVRLHDLYIL